MDALELSAVMTEEEIQNELSKLSSEELLKVCLALKVGPQEALVDAIITTSDPHALLDALHSIGVNMKPTILVTKEG